MFRSIRLLNEAFQTRVASVPGGLEVFLAAGFVLADEAVDGEEVTFLKHDMSLQSERKLDYAVHRIRSLVQ